MYSVLLKQVGGLLVRVGSRWRGVQLVGGVNPAERRVVLLYIYLWEGIVHIRLRCGGRLYREGCRVDQVRSKVVGRLRGLSDLVPLVEYLRGGLYQGQSGVARDALGCLRRRCCPRLHWCTGTRHCHSAHLL